jgi:hypothetical protein
MKQNNKCKARESGLGEEHVRARQIAHDNIVK